MYTTLQPELLKEQARREGEDPIFAKNVTPAQHERHEQEAAEAQRDTAVSRAMARDFREAGEQVRSEGGFAWGIRRAIFGTGGKKEGEGEK